MRYYFDTEFIEDGITIDLISIAIKAEDGRKFYCISTEFDPDKASEWVVANVFPFLVNPDGTRKDPECWKTRAQIKDDLLEFVGDDKPEFWAWYASYDWVALAQLFGKMIDLPDHFPMWCHELRQLSEQKGSPQKPEQEDEHHPMADAEFVETFYQQLIGMPDVTKNRAH